jgi:hypothetical protein
MAFGRITIDHNKMGGVSCIRDLRLPASTVVGQLAAGRSIDEALQDSRPSSIKRASRPQPPSCTAAFPGKARVRPSVPWDVGPHQVLHVACRIVYP